MKAILQFIMPEDEDDYKHAVNGRDYYLALCDIENLIRKHIKYDEALTEDTERILITIRSLLPEDL